MSSSDDDIYFVPSKPLKRRKFKKLDESTFENVSLFSNKVMPTIYKTNEAILKQMNKADEAQKEKKVKKEATVEPISDLEAENSSDEDIKFVCEMSPIKDIPVTPPPAKQERVPPKNSRFEKKKRKLLENVATMLQKVKQDEILSQSQDVELVESICDDNFVVVKIRFQSVVHKYSMLKDTAFAEVFKTFASDVHVDQDELLLMLNDVRIYSSDTPEKVGLTVVDFIDAFVVDKNVLLANRHDPSNKENFIQVHFQSKFEKHKQTFSVNKFTPFVETMKLYADRIGHELHQLCYLFDGETIDGTLSCEELEIDNDYCIDVVRTKKK